MEVTFKMTVAIVTHILSLLAHDTSLLIHLLLFPSDGIQICALAEVTPELPWVTLIYIHLA